MMLNFSSRLLLTCFLPAAIFILSCQKTDSSSFAKNESGESIESVPIIAESFAYPVSEKEYVTQAKDKKDDWYNALDFGENNHLGEDWNKNSGGNTDCGEPVYAAATGTITLAENAGPGWGNVLIITHTLENGNKVQTLYGHLQEILKTSGEVKKREKIGKVGNADGKYLCHLHFELREETNSLWNQAGSGYSSNRKGWLDPSDFIDKRRK